MDKTHSSIPFPVHISVENSSDTISATTLLKQFIEQASQRYQLTLIAPPSGTHQQADAIISVPFPHREHIRIDFNIFASDIEDLHGSHFYFHMESA